MTSITAPPNIPPQSSEDSGNETTWRERIEEAIATGKPLDRATTRVLAAAIHPGPASHLAHFAATGEIHLDAINRELHAIKESQRWVFMLREAIHHLADSEAPR